MELRDLVDRHVADHKEQWVGYVSMPLSYLRHYVYCPRSAYLSYSHLFAENRFTAEGSNSHSVVDSMKSRYNIRGKVHNSVYVWSDALLIHGICDAVEQNGIVYLPVEHKRSRIPKEGSIMQAVGQALCLASMNPNANVEELVIYSFSTRKRTAFLLADHISTFFDWHVRALTSFNSHPNMQPDQRIKCRGCSLHSVCLPDSGLVFSDD